ncbi:unnamed protein product [Dicrocoelium dendriticum]|nr:unnamed protein product [Dicrocoelium dendriticum]
MPLPQIYFNPFLTWYDPFKQQQVSTKYGVVSLHSVMRDLTFWSDLYIAGRLHKPVLWAPYHNHVADSQSELCDKFKIAHLPPDTEILEEPDLLHSLVSISYDGDWRMLVSVDTVLKEFSRNVAKVKTVLVNAVELIGRRDWTSVIEANERLVSQNRQDLLHHSG